MSANTATTASNESRSETGEVEASVRHASLRKLRLEIQIAQEIETVRRISYHTVRRADDVWWIVEEIRPILEKLDSLGTELATVDGRIVNEG